MGSINSIMIFFKASTEVHSTTSGIEVQRRANEKCLMCRKCDITGGGVSGKNVRKCEKGDIIFEQPLMLILYTILILFFFFHFPLSISKLYL